MGEVVGARRLRQLALRVVTPRLRRLRLAMFSLALSGSIVLWFAAGSAHFGVIAPYRASEVVVLFTSVGLFVLGGVGLWLEWIGARRGY
ncbi:MAG: hypothetical protein AABM40_04730 [Chloroflexota bacterium]